MTDRQAVQDQVAGLERQYWRAIKDRNFAAAIELTADPCIVTGAQGVGEIDHETFRTMMNSATWTLNDVELDDFKVRLVGDDVAIVAYKVRESVTVDGEELTLEAADASTWVRHDGRWRCALHTEAIAGDPFGRDRKQARAAGA
jgi:uncharacterized protein (TIGR02246 family)